MFMLDFLLYVFLAPALILAGVAQWMVQSAYSRMSRIGTRMTGFEAARRILDSSGLYNVEIEPIAGQMTDHYDPSSRVLRLSEGVYATRSMAAVGIAAHEAGHALQHARNYAPLSIRSMAVPLASIGSGIGATVASLGVFLVLSAVPIGKTVLLLGIVLFGSLVLFQLINLPVEFDASSRAKKLLVSERIILSNELTYVSKVLNAAALTYVAATLQSVLTLAYYVFRLMHAREER